MRGTRLGYLPGLPALFRFSRGSVFLLNARKESAAEVAGRLWILPSEYVAVVGYDSAREEARPRIAVTVEQHSRSTRAAAR